MTKQTDGYKVIKELQMKCSKDTKEYLTILSKDIEQAVNNPLLRMKFGEYVYDVLFMAYGRGIMDCIEMEKKQND